MPSNALRTAATAALGAAIVGPAGTHVIFSDFERYRAPEATSATFVAGEGHESFCWLPRGRGAAPSPDHCYEFPPAEGGPRRREIQTYSGHCFGFLNGSDVVTGSACVARGRTEHGPDSSSVLDRLLELRASASAALARQRRRIYRALQLLLLADVAFFGAGSTGRRRKGPPAPVWTTHHLFLSVGVGTMLLDHAAKGLLNHGGSLLTMPAQVGGACWFYYLGGANTRPDGRGAAVALIAVHAVLLELMPLPGEIHPYTLITIALARLCVRPLVAPPPADRPPSLWRALLRPDAARWSPLLHAALAALLVASEEALGYGGLQLAYGSRGLTWAVAGRLRSHSRHSGDAAACAALPHELAAFALHVHLTLQNSVGAVCRGGVSEGACSAVYLATIPAIVVQAALLHTYTFRSLHPLDRRGSASGLGGVLRAAARRTSYALAHYSLQIYFVHILAIVAWGRWVADGGGEELS